eukprot:TRINITY_DN8672_c0_g1_i3.p1 TRINITY_DN8672_c0_g1~~TRINITY_DN8672_c0_g1_i3.p1  ORF type:complete len:296 (-),score=55.37 TRINITY_DN8672_c0_g1_i3:11-802(-)
MGSEIDSVKKNVLEIIKTIDALPQCLNLRYGLIGYEDHCDPKVLHLRVPLTTDISLMTAGVSQMRAAGGGDYPEAVADGLHQLVRMDWRRDAIKTAVLVADAPPHGVQVSGDSYPDGCPCGEDWLEQAESLREMGIILHTVGCRGFAQKHVFEKMSEITWGRYFSLGEASQLPKLITGVADQDLDRARVRSLVQASIDKSSNALMKLQDEDDRLDQLFSDLQIAKVQPRSLDPSKGWCLAPRLQIGRAVQQECRDRSRMPSSA